MTSPELPAVPPLREPMTKKSMQGDLDVGFARLAASAPERPVVKFCTTHGQELFRDGACESCEIERQDAAPVLPEGGHARDSWKQLSVTAIAAENASVYEYVSQLEAQLLEAAKPDSVCVVGQTDDNWYRVDDLMSLSDDIRVGGVAEVNACKMLPNQWAAHIDIDYELAGDSEVRLFATEAEARAAIDASRIPPADHTGGDE